jgi:hypothetical protein
MASNPYLNNFNANNEQNLVENLVVEAIKFYAHDVVYIPRHGVNPDTIFNEMEYSSFSNTANVEVYIKNFSSFGGENVFLSKFGMEVRDSMTLQMSIRSFNQFVAPVSGKTRPDEGDLIFIPMTKACYQISYVENAAIFYQLGKIQSYELKCDLFEYSNEIFATGNGSIDGIAAKYDTVTDIDHDAFNQNDPIQVEANTVLDWSANTPFGEF